MGTRGFVHVGTLPAADTQWPVAGVCNGSVSAQIWGWHHVAAFMHTNTHTGTNVESRQPPCPGQIHRWGPTPPKMGDSGGEQRPSAKISAAAYRSRSASKAHHLPIKRGIKLCCSPPTSSLLSLTSSPWGNHHLYMRFSPFFNLFSAPCHTDPRGLAARLGLPASLEAGCFSHPPPWEPAPGQFWSMPPVLPSQFVPPNPHEYLQPLSHTFSRLLEQPNPLLSTLPR